MLLSLLAGTLLFATAIALRWLRTGYGPFLTMFEVLLSNLFSLGLIYTLAFWRVPLVRSGAPLAVSLLLLLGIWALNVSPRVVQLPATYQSAWLWVHVGVGKVFLGTCLVALGLAGTLLVRRLLQPQHPPRAAAVEAMLDAVVWRFMVIAFVFHSLMLIAGAVWAQDAWGRYWAWDSLETWAFITWLAIGVSLHARVTYRLPMWSGWVMVMAVFALAFITFFGVPFSSLGPHRGVL